MGRTRGPYNEEFPKGTLVRIVELSALEEFRENWQLHNKLEPEQLGYAGQIAQVESVSFYHGGDELYALQGIPGVWHEACLEVAATA